MKHAFSDHQKASSQVALPYLHLITYVIHTFSYSESSQLRSQLLLLILWIMILHNLKGRLREVQLIQVMLRENRASQFVISNDLAVNRNQITNQQLQ